VAFVGHRFTPLLTGRDIFPHWTNWVAALLLSLSKKRVYPSLAGHFTAAVPGGHVISGSQVVRFLLQAGQFLVVNVKNAAPRPRHRITGLQVLKTTYNIVNSK
jgi:hypothetical protein